MPGALMIANESSVAAVMGETTGGLLVSIVRVAARCRLCIGVGVGVISPESRGAESDRPDDLVLVRECPQEVRRSFLALDGGLGEVCKGIKA